jgi:hypothetical protein
MALKRSVRFPQKLRKARWPVRSPYLNRVKRHLSGECIFLLLQNDVTMQADSYTDVSARCCLLNPHDGPLTHDNATVGPLGKSQNKIDVISLGGLYVRVKENSLPARVPHESHVPLEVGSVEHHPSRQA